MKTRAPARSCLIMLPVLAVLALGFLACAGAGLLLTQPSTLPGTPVRSFRPTGLLECHRFPARPRSLCAWSMGLDTVLAIQGQPDDVIATFDPQHLAYRLGPVQLTIGAQVTEADNPQLPPLFPVSFGFSLLVGGTP